MPTLKAMFKLFDGYSSTIDKINRKTDQATTKITNASGSTDKFNAKLKKTGASASGASSGLSKFVSVAALFAGAVKGMSIMDEYTNTNARLALINDGLQTQAELQDEIFSAANRSRGAYSDMAAAISKMGLLAKDSFKSNDELIAFTELVQKSFRVGGASTQEQQAGMYQLTQAMAAGKLQGDEFRSIMENAPMIGDAIAKATGKSKGELKKMSAEGTITADIIKRSMFAAGNDINEKFSKMPMSFADIWNKIKNISTKAFAPVMQTVSGLLNSPEFEKFITAFAVGIDVLAGVVSWLIKTIINGWDVIGPILGVIATVYLVHILGQIIMTTAALFAQAAAWVAAYWPVLLIIGVIFLAIAAARQFGASWEEIFGFIGGIIGVFVTYFYNKFVSMWNVVAAFINFFGNVFKNPIASIKALFYDLAANVLGFIQTMAKGIEDLINKIPGVEVNITGGIENLKGKLEKASATIKSEAGLKEYVKSKEFMDFSEGYNKGSDIGKKLPGAVSGAMDKLASVMNNSKEMDLSKFSDGSPIKVEGKGKNGAVKVDMDEEDLKYLRDIAEREYINKFSTATLAPNIQISFGDVHETADMNKIQKRMRKILQDEIAMASEGAY